MPVEQLQVAMGRDKQPRPAKPSASLINAPTQQQQQPGNQSKRQQQCDTKQPKRKENITTSSSNYWILYL